MKHKKSLLSQWFLFSWRDLFLSAAILICAVCFCIFLQMADTTEGFASPIFVLAVLLISRFTSGYLFGSIAGCGMCQLHLHIPLLGSELYTGWIPADVPHFFNGIHHHQHSHQSSQTAGTSSGGKRKGEDAG